MKVALCICGLINNYKDSYPYLKERILDKFNPDVYMHSWEFNEEVIKDIKELYNPVKFIFEKQNNFADELKKFNLSKYEFDYKGSSVLKLLSYTYSRKSCVELVEEGKYDAVILCRFDVYAWHGDVMRDLSVLTFSESFDFNNIYTKHWNQLNAGFAEQWFVGNVENIRKISNLYYKLEEYMKEDSEYMKMIFDGWPLSNANNEFTNEMEKPEEERSIELLKGNDYCVLNNHYLYKYHIYKNGLIDKCRFT
jgi:hypothetical protein